MKIKLSTRTIVNVPDYSSPFSSWIFWMYWFSYMEIISSPSLCAQLFLCPMTSLCVYLNLWVSSLSSNAKIPRAVWTVTSTPPRFSLSFCFCGYLDNFLPLCGKRIGVWACMCVSWPEWVVLFLVFQAVLFYKTIYPNEKLCWRNTYEDLKGQISEHF